MWEEPLYLPTHRILVVTHEVGELKSLFDLLEEDFNGSACLIEVTNGTCRPSEVVGNESHAFGLSVDIDDCLDQTQSFRIPDASAFSPPLSACDVSPNPDSWRSTESLSNQLHGSCAWSVSATHSIASLESGSSDWSHSNEQELPRTVFPPYLRRDSGLHGTDYSGSVKRNLESCSPDRNDSEAYCKCRSDPVHASAVRRPEPKYDSSDWTRETVCLFRNHWLVSVSNFTVSIWKFAITRSFYALLWIFFIFLTFCDL